MIKAIGPLRVHCSHDQQPSPFYNDEQLGDDPWSTPTASTSSLSATSSIFKDSVDGVVNASTLPSIYEQAWIVGLDSSTSFTANTSFHLKATTAYLSLPALR